jgi:GntR family transcriptional regulator/MocR family aminotransferase
VTLSRWLYDEIRSAILDGRLPAGWRLPATRDLASLYGVSRRIAVGVFEQLASEGYLTGKVGSGTQVNETLPDDLLNVRLPRRRRVERSAPATPDARRPAQPFRAIEPALLEFPVELWARVASRRLRRISPSLLAGGEAAGHLPLREAIAGYLGASRGVKCEAARVAIVSGVQQAVDLLARLLVRPGDPVWIEDPGYSGTVAAFRNAGARIIAVPVDGDGLDVAAGRKASPTARLVYITPAHQFPLGVTMSLDRRLLLLKWAHESGARIIEDDYDSEFRFIGRPISALQGLDRSDSVIYTGTFNKVLFPALRLAYVVLPHDLVDPFRALRSSADRYPPGISQAVLCDFIVEGHFGRHLRRMREIYAERLGLLQENARRYLAGTVELPPIQAGLNIPAYLLNGMNALEAHARAADRGIETATLDQFALKRRDLRGLLLGFAAFDAREIKRGVLALAEALGSKSVS